MADEDDIAQSEIERVAAEIRRYLNRSPDAAETADGILHWWIVRIRLEEAKTLVDSAIAHLEGQGEIERRVRADGVVRYVKRKQGQ
jgi:hypothetical protein